MTKNIINKFQSTTKISIINFLKINKNLVILFPFLNI